MSNTLIIEQKTMENNLPKEIVKPEYRMVAILRKSTKVFECQFSKQPIYPGTSYYQVIVTGAGVAGEKYADRVLPEFLGQYWAKQHRLPGYPEPCVCQIGTGFCDEARRLWDEVEKAVWADRHLPEDNRVAYRQAMKNYFEHFSGKQQ